VYNDQLLVTGGHDANLKATSNCIHKVQLIAPYNVTTFSGMPEPRQRHFTEIFDDSLLIAGGRTTGHSKDSLSSVVLYDIKKNECKQLAPLPYEVSNMADVKWGENIVIIGGINERSEALNTVIMYNVKTEQSRMLPPMKYKRCGCTAVVIRGHIVVLGGYGEHGTLKSVEAFNFENNTWQELPEMSQARCYHTAVAV
jgi:N-acetylneuraminic acid mutarotase